MVDRGESRTDVLLRLSIKVVVTVINIPVANGLLGMAEKKSSPSRVQPEVLGKYFHLVIYPWQYLRASELCERLL